MNIFALSKCPHESARQMLDKHIVKMPTETCQMLHTNILYMQFVNAHGKEPTQRELKAFHKASKSKLMKPAMLNHPSTIWARQSFSNFMWLFEHGLALCEEHKIRYPKEDEKGNIIEHGSYHRIRQCNSHTDLVIDFQYNEDSLTPVFIAMDDRYRIKNTFDDGWEYVIQSYRHYYLEGKWDIAEWKNNRRPDWFPANHFAKKYNVGVRAYNSRNPRYPKQLMEE
tara:strand:+ start:4610 stop:5284 length:675 start_codon:yes stop_codon:yes gene_type:complete